MDYKTDSQTLHRDLLAKDGHSRYILKVVEELCELAAILAKWSHGELRENSLFDELADVEIQMGKLKYLMDNTKSLGNYAAVVRTIKTVKLEALENYVKR